MIVFSPFQSKDGVFTPEDAARITDMIRTMRQSHQMRERGQEEDLRKEMVWGNHLQQHK